MPQSTRGARGRLSRDAERTARIAHTIRAVLAVLALVVGPVSVEIASGNDDHTGPAEGPTINCASDGVTTHSTIRAFR